MITDKERSQFFKHLAKRDVGKIYRQAKQRSAELKKRSEPCLKHQQ